jgi:predicted nucleotidyltransferase
MVWPAYPAEKVQCEQPIGAWGLTKDVLVAREGEDVNCKSLDSVHVHNSEVSFSATLFSALSKFHPQACIQVSVQETDDLKRVRHHERGDHKYTQNSKPVSDFQFV